MAKRLQEVFFHQMPESVSSDELNHFIAMTYHEIHRGMDGCDGYRACIDDGVEGGHAFPHEGPPRQWLGARGGDGGAPSLPVPRPPEPNLTAARHLRARKLPLPFAPPPPTTTHPGDKGYPASPPGTQFSRREKRRGKKARTLFRCGGTNGLRRIARAPRARRNNRGGVCSPWSDGDAGDR